MKSLSTVVTKYYICFCRTLQRWCYVKKRYFSARGINKPCRKCLKRKCRSACIIYYKAFIIQRQQRLGWGWWSFTWWFFLSCRDEVIVTNEQSFGLWWWLSVPYIKYYVYTNVSISIWYLKYHCLLPTQTS